MIAADLTAYSNPLDSALSQQRTSPKPPPKMSDSQKAATAEMPKKTTESAKPPADNSTSDSK